jgi:hypothetical protein
MLTYDRPSTSLLRKALFKYVHDHSRHLDYQFYKKTTTESYDPLDGLGDPLLQHFFQMLNHPRLVRRLSFGWHGPSRGHEHSLGPVDPFVRCHTSHMSHAPQLMRSSEPLILNRPTIPEAFEPFSATRPASPDRTSSGLTLERLRIVR